MTIGGDLVKYITAPEIIDVLKEQKIDEAVYLRAKGMAG